MMKRITLLLLPLLMIGCSQDSESNGASEDSNIIDLMTEGNDADPGSRYAWELERLKDPSTGQIPPNIHRLEKEFASTLPVHQNKAFSWENRGPVNVGGRTRALAMDVLDENIWLAGGVSGGIWRSQDAGQTWAKVTNDLDLHSVTSIVQDTRPGHENTWYAGTGEHYAIVSHVTFEARFSGDGVLKSTDNGLTWSPLTSTQSNTPNTYLVNGDMDFVWRVVTDPTDMVNDVVLAAVYNGVYRSEDGGATWSQVLGFTQGSFSAPASDYLDLIVTPSGVFYATLSSDGPDKGIYRSDDGGVTWTDIKPSGFPGSWGRMTMAYNPLDDDVIWMFGAASSGFANSHGVFRYQYLSGDGSGTGGSWSDRSAQLPDNSCTIPGLTTDIGALNTQSSFDVHVGVHPVDTNVIYIAGTSIWRNTDGFTADSTNTWIGGYHCSQIPFDSLGWGLSYPNHHPDQHLLMFQPSDPSVMINANDGGLYKTVDNLADTVEWIPLNNGYVTTQFYAVAIEPGNATSDIVIGGLQDNGTWFTNTNEFDSTWKYIGSGDGMYCAITEGLDYYITSKQRGKLYLKEIDADGNVLSHERIDPEGGPLTYNWANSLRLDPSNNKRLFWNGRNKLWRLDDLTQVPITMDRTNKEQNHWVVLDSSQTDPQAATITDIEMCETDTGKVWYGTTNGWLYRLDNAYASLPDHPSKVNLTSPDWPFNAYISCVAVNPFNSNQIVVTFANYGVPSIWWTSDGGQTWDDISGNLEENPDGSGAGPAVFWAEYYVDGTMFVGTSTGLYTCAWPDSANTVWTLEPGVGNVPVDHMDFRHSDGYFVVGTHGQGIFSTHLTPGFVSASDYSKQVLSVYPNPAANQIHVKMPPKAYAVRVYDLSGRMVLSKMGMHEVDLDVSELRSGTYIVHAVSEDQKWTSKFVKR